MTFDNFQVGTCTEQIAAEKLTLSEDGKLTVTYSGKVVGATFTASNVVIKKDGEGVSYNGSYDSETYTYTATIANFDPYADYTVSIKGITGFGGKPVQEVEKTFKGVKYLFSPVLTDTYDDGTATFDWQPDWSPSTTYVDETGRGKVAAVTFKEENKDSTTETNIVLTELSQYMTSDVNYISFDIKPAQLMNMSFSPTDVTNVVYPLTLFSSENGWFWGSGSRIPTQYGDDLPTIYGNTRATLVGWGFSASSFADTEVGKWYNVKFIMDKKNGKIAVYVDDVKLDEVSASATELSSIDRLLVRDCSASKTGPNMYIDNFQIGAAFPAPSKDTSITLVDASGNAITNGTTAAEVYPKAVINNTGKEAGSVQLSVASYDADGVLLDVKVETVTVAAGEIKTVTSSYGVKTQGTKTVKAFLWSGWSNITPLVGADVKTVNN